MAGDRRKRRSDVKYPLIVTEQIQPIRPPELYISDATVKTHITHLLQKPCLHDRVQAVEMRA